MLIPSGLKTKIDGRLNLLLTHLEARQDTYFTAHGRYFQGIRTHAVLPKGEIDEETPPNSRVKPTDQAEDWDDARILLPAKMPFALAIDVYDGPRGKGWSARVEVDYRGSFYSRRVGFGPDAADHTHDWKERA